MSINGKCITFPQVILVSTSGASGAGGGVYQRSLSVPVMKGGTGTAPTVMRGMSASNNTTPSSQIQTGIWVNEFLFQFLKYVS